MATSAQNKLGKSLRVTVAPVVSILGKSEIMRTRGAVLSLTVFLLAVSAAVPALGQERKAIWVSAKKSELGVNVVRDDGRVVSYWDVSGVKGPRIIPGLENIVATTARLALRNDGVILTWTPKCGGNPDNPDDVDHEFCEFPPAREVAGLRNIVAISEDSMGCYVALDRDGAVFGWGDDSNGLISGRPAVPQPFGKPFKRRLVRTPTRIPLPAPMSSISAATSHVGAVDRIGHVWMWGGGEFFSDVHAPGEDYPRPNGFVARKVSGIPPARSIDSGYVITRTGEVWRWGISRVNGVRGSVIPNRVPGLSDAVALSAIGFFTAIMDQDGIVLFIGIAPDVENYGKFIDEPHATKLMPRAKFISAGARITTEGDVLLFRKTRSGIVQSLELGD